MYKMGMLWKGKNRIKTGVQSLYLPNIFLKEKPQNFRITATCKNIGFLLAQATKFRTVDPNIFNIVTAVFILTD